MVDQKWVDLFGQHGESEGQDELTEEHRRELDKTTSKVIEGKSAEEEHLAQKVNDIPAPSTQLKPSGKSTEFERPIQAELTYVRAMVEFKQSLERITQFTPLMVRVEAGLGLLKSLQAVLFQAKGIKAEMATIDALKSTLKDLLKGLPGLKEQMVAVLQIDSVFKNSLVGRKITKEYGLKSFDLFLMPDTFASTAAFLLRRSKKGLSHQHRRVFLCHLLNVDTEEDLAERVKTVVQSFAEVSENEEENENQQPLLERLKTTLFQEIIKFLMDEDEGIANMAFYDIDQSIDPYLSPEERSALEQFYQAGPEELVYDVASPRLKAVLDVLRDDLPELFERAIRIIHSLMLQARSRYQQAEERSWKIGALPNNIDEEDIRDFNEHILAQESPADFRLPVVRDQQEDPKRFFSFTSTREFQGEIQNIISGFRLDIPKIRREAEKMVNKLEFFQAKEKLKALAAKRALQIAGSKSPIEATESVKTEKPSAVIDEEI